MKLLVRITRRRTPGHCKPGHHRLLPVSQPMHARSQWRWRCANCPAVWATYPDEVDT
jgi:hypothetical protein